MAQGAKATTPPVCPCPNTLGWLLLLPYKGTVRQRGMGLGDNSRALAALEDSQRLPLNSQECLPTQGHPVLVRWLPPTCRGQGWGGGWFPLTQCGDLQGPFHFLGLML